MIEYPTFPGYGVRNLAPIVCYWGKGWTPYLCLIWGKMLKHPSLPCSGVETVHSISAWYGGRDWALCVPTRGVKLITHLRRARGKRRGELLARRTRLRGDLETLRRRGLEDARSISLVTGWSLIIRRRSSKLNLDLLADNNMTTHETHDNTHDNITEMVYIQNSSQETKRILFCLHSVNKSKPLATKGASFLVYVNQNLKKYNQENYVTSLQE